MSHLHKTKSSLHTKKQLNIQKAAYISNNLPLQSFQHCHVQPQCVLYCFHLVACCLWHHGNYQCTDQAKPTRYVIKVVPLLNTETLRTRPVVMEITNVQTRQVVIKVCTISITHSIIKTSSSFLKSETITINKMLHNITDNLPTVLI